jgi:drug/metabolite transporter (DMT)-like permease
MKMGIKGFPPFLFAALRQFTAGILLTAYLLFIKKYPLPSRRDLMSLALGGFLMITLGNGLVSSGLVYVPSSVAAIICSAMPVCVVLLNLTINRAERPNATIIVGVMAGMFGIVMVFAEHLADFSKPGYAGGIALIFIATVSWGMASFLMKKINEKVSPFVTAGFQMLFGGLFCVPLSLFFDDYSTITWTATSIGAITYLSLIGSLTAYAMYSYTLAVLPLTIASLYSYINPLVAVVLGWWILAETLNVRIVAAIAVTLFGIYLVNRGYQQITRPRA